MTESLYSNLVVEAAEKLLRDLADPQKINHTKDDSWRSTLWAALEDSGLPLSWVSQKLGGSGASMAEGFALLHLAGRYALPVPMAETMLAGWLLSQASIPSPGGAMTVAPLNPNDQIILNGEGTLSGRARAIPFAMQSDHVAVLAHDSDGLHIALIKQSDCQYTSMPSLSGDDVADLTLECVKPVILKPAPSHWTSKTLALMGATARSLQIGGALQWILTQTITYSTERVAFKKPISKFQAIQHNLARLASETAAATTAAASAAQSLCMEDVCSKGIFLEISSAKIRCAEAAAAGCAIAHQVHGAIGFTAEHTLHRFTLRALAWRDDFGSETYWSIALGQAVASLGSDQLWPLITSR